MEEIFLELKKNSRIASKGWHVQTIGNVVFVLGPNRNHEDSDTIVVISKTILSNIVVELYGNGTVFDSQLIIDIISKNAPLTKIYSSQPLESEA